MPNKLPNLDRVFRALADPTRRTVVERLSQHPATVSELAEPFNMALPSFLQHLDVLEDCGLVTSKKAGRVRTYSLTPKPLQVAEDWMAAQRTMWDRRLNQLDSYLHKFKQLKGESVMKPILFKPDPKLDLVLERVVDVPREMVWAAWTTPEQILQWFTPDPWKTVDCRIDLRPGGEFYTMMQSPEGEKFPNNGCFLEVVPYERLVFTDAMGPGYRPSANPFMTAAVILEPQGADRTKYTAIAIHGDEETRKKHIDMGFTEGWGKALDQLVALVKKNMRK